MFDEMKRYIRFADEDERLLVQLRPLAAPHFQRIAEEFYDRIREHEDAHAVFTGEAQIVRLQSSLVRWMERVCSAPHDQAYFLETAKIGRIHVRIGLPQRYMFTAMTLIRGSLERMFEEDLTHCVEINAERWQRRSVLNKAASWAAYLLRDWL